MIYINKKTGQEYNLLSIGTDCTNNRDGLQVAIYKPNDIDIDSIYVRELKEFEEKFVKK